MTIETQPVDEAVYRLRKLLATEGMNYGSTLPWTWEGDRWRELAFALISRVTGLGDTAARVLTEQLADLDLLDLDEIAKLRSGQALPASRRIIELMAEAGVDEETSRVALTTVAEAAHGFQENFAGKVQSYLRHYGELMLHEVGQTFHFTAAKPQVVSEAFTYWLQNVINMPLSLADDTVEEFCRRYGFAVAELFEAADRLDMNWALLDDLIKLHQEVAANPQTG